MAIMYRLLGLTAYVDHALSKFAIYYIIRVNLILFGALFLGIIIGLISLRTADQVGQGEQVGQILRVVICSVLLMLLVTSWLHQNTIFRPSGLRYVPANTSPVASTKPVSNAYDLRLTCRLSRGSGNTISLHDFPAKLCVAAEGTISIETFVVIGSSPFADLLSADTSGAGAVTLSRASLLAGLESGLLYWGLFARPAFRITHKQYRSGVIVTVPNGQTVAQFAAWLEAILTESAIREAELRQRLLQVPHQATSSNDLPKAPTPETIPWDKLINLT